MTNVNPLIRNSLEKYIDNMDNCPDDVRPDFKKLCNDLLDIEAKDESSGVNEGIEKLYNQRLDKYLKNNVNLSEWGKKYVNDN